MLWLNRVFCSNALQHPTPTGPRTAGVEASNHHGGSSVLPPHPMQGRHYRPHDSDCWSLSGSKNVCPASARAARHRSRPGSRVLRRVRPPRTGCVRAHPRGGRSAGGWRCGALEGALSRCWPKCLLKFLSAPVDNIDPYLPCLLLVCLPTYTPDRLCAGSNIQSEPKGESDGVVSPSLR